MRIIEGIAHESRACGWVIAGDLVQKRTLHQGIARLRGLLHVGSARLGAEGDLTGLARVAIVVAGQGADININIGTVISVIAKGTHPAPF